MFKHKYAEQPDMVSITFEAIVKNNSIVLINKSESEVFPKGVIDEGKIFWHYQTSQWIIASTKLDETTLEVGGCSSGPNVIDLKKMIYWTC